MSAHQEQVRGFAKYNLEFNGKLFHQLSELADAERKKDMGAFFGSIHGTRRRAAGRLGQAVMRVADAGATPASFWC